MTNRGVPKWYDRLLDEQRREEEDACFESLTPSKRMTVDAFIDTAGRCFWTIFCVEANHFGAGDLAARRRFEAELRAAIEAACAAGEPWLRLVEQPGWMPHRRSWLELDPRAAAAWLLSKPGYQQLVPPMWARVVLGNAWATPEGRTASDKPAGRARGPKPNTRERVVEAMRGMARDKIGRDELRAMKQERMRAVFGACERARKEVLSEIVGVANAAK